MEDTNNARANDYELARLRQQLLGVTVERDGPLAEKRHLRRGHSGI